MKLKLTFLLLASVFFVSCGMPTIFAPSTSEYTLQKEPPFNPDSVEGKLEMRLSAGPNYDLLENSETKGPSLMFFYTFDSGIDSEYQLTPYELTYTMPSKFKQAFNKDIYGAKPVYNPKEVAYIEKDDVKIYLYGVNSSTGSNFNAKDQYVLTANIGNKAALDTFKLVKVDASPEQYSLQLSWTDTSPSTPNFYSNVQSSGNMLYSFNGNRFPLKQSEINALINSNDNTEYNFVENYPTKVRLHLYAAFFISGPFSNFFWSDLVYLDSIPIDLVSY